MVKKLILALCLITSLSIASCIRNIKPSETIISEHYSFNRISGLTAASRGVIVYYTQQEGISVKAEGPANMMKLLKIKSDASDMLMIEIRNPDLFDIKPGSYPVKVWVSSPQIGYISALNESSISVPEPIELPRTLRVESYVNSFIEFSDVKVYNLMVEAYVNSSIKFSDVKVYNLMAEAYVRSGVSFDNIEASSVTTDSEIESTITNAGKPI